MSETSMTPACASLDPPSTPGISWSHDALQVASLGVPDAIWHDIEAGRTPSVDHPFAIGYEVMDIHEPMLRAPRPPTREAAEAWATGTYEALIARDRYYALAWQLAALGKVPAKSDHARKYGAAGQALADPLVRGLTAREGSWLDRAAENVYIHLIARTPHRRWPKRLRVCEWCLIVFDAPRARRCPACRHNGRGALPSRHQTSVLFGRGPDREVRFVGECAEPGCTRTYHGDSRTKYCPEHASGRARKARHDARQAA